MLQARTLQTGSLLRDALLLLRLVLAASSEPSLISLLLSSYFALLSVGVSQLSSLSLTVNLSVMILDSLPAALLNST